MCYYLPTIQISYSLLEDRSWDHQYFRIDPELGFIYTQTVFDRETKSSYLLEVQSVDGWESARPGKHGQSNSGKYDWHVASGNAQGATRKYYFQAWETFNIPITLGKNMMLL